ncbi:MAG: acetyl-CoA acetyltransferase [Actinomycetota bacterium]
MNEPVFILGGAQTDFAVHWTRAELTLFDLLSEAVLGALDAADVDAADVEVAHVGNFVAELFTGQGMLGGWLGHVHADLAGTPASRHEGACASGSLAALAAMADLQSDRYGIACVAGVELMRNVSGLDANRHLGAAVWVGREAIDRPYVWPAMFSDLAEEYDRRYGLDHVHLMGIAEKNFGNAKHNPNAQTRSWSFTPESFTDDDEANPVVDGWMRRQDCSQITDGAAVVVLASARAAQEWAARTGRDLDTVPRIDGWGHTTAPMLLETKLRDSASAEHVFPWVRRAITDAYRRAGIAGPEQLDAIETHDCFTINEYMAIEHFGLTAPGEAWKAVEDGRINREGELPVNPSGGLMGLGHPVGATGVRMLLDASKQVAGTAGDYQIGGARRVATYNVGGSATTNCSFVVAAGPA